VAQSEPIKKLEAFANSNKQTQGKFTIGDEKVGSLRVPDCDVLVADMVCSNTMSSCGSM